MNAPSPTSSPQVTPPEEFGRWLGEIVDDHYDGAWAWEPATGRLWCSDALLADLGIDRDEFVPHYESFRERLDPAERERVEAELGAYVGAEADYRIEFRMRHSDGSWRDFDNRTTFGVSADGSRWYAGIMRDRTEELCTRRALEQSEARFRRLAEDIPGAVFRYVLGSDGRDGIEYMSPGCERVFGVSAAEVQDDAGAIWRTIVDEDVPRLRASIEHSARSREHWDQNFRVRMGDGTLKWLHGRGMPTPQEDGSTLWNSIVLDISDLRSTEAELRESQARLARASKLEAIGKLTGGIAHDFNNLLAVIVGNAELLQTCRNDDERGEVTAQILAAAERGSALTRSLLNFARQAPLAPTTVDLVAVVQDAQDLYRRTVPEFIRVETALPAEALCATVDRNTLENALLNLVINARDAMPDGGTLTLRVRSVEGPAETWLERDLPRGTFHEITVSDTGVGIEPDLLEHVFDPFFSTKSLSEGSGLGLSMVQGFTSQSGGSVRIDSRRGRGTEVAMLFPAVPAATTQPEGVKAPATRRLPALRTLLVEDDPGVRRLLASLLGRAGLDVCTAETGDAALQLLNADAGIEMLVTDMVLPGTAQGTDVIREVRALRPAMPILVLTGYAEDGSLRPGEGGADAVLTKPVRRDLLVDTLAGIISRHATAR